MVGGHCIAALLGCLLVLAGVYGECFNDGNGDLFSLHFKKQDKLQDEVARIREKMQEEHDELVGIKEKLQVELAGMREKMQDEVAGMREKMQVELAGMREKMQDEVAGMREKMQEEINKLKIDRMEERLAQKDDKISTLVASINPASETNISHITTAIDVLTNGLSEIQTTVEDLQARVEDHVSSDSGSDQELTPRNNTTNVHNGLNQVRTMVQGLQVKVEELAANRQLSNNQNNYNNTRKPRYCHDIYIQGERRDGVYEIYPGWNLTQSVSVWCEFDVGSELGWTRILARMPTEVPVNFSRGWDDYKAGFGDAHNEYWIGLSLLHEIFLSHCSQVLQVNLQSWDQTSAYAQYKDFSIGNEETGFKLSIGEYSGDAGDSLDYNNGWKFTTIDKDNDGSRSNCAINDGAFWHDNCYYTNPFDDLRKKEDNTGGMRWDHWLSDVNLKKIIFKISPRLPSII